MIRVDVLLSGNAWHAITPTYDDRLGRTSEIPITMPIMNEMSIKITVPSMSTISFSLGNRV
jgi:hypothetical protein